MGEKVLYISSTNNLNYNPHHFLFYADVYSRRNECNAGGSDLFLLFWEKLHSVAKSVVRCYQCYLKQHERANFFHVPEKWEVIPIQWSISSNWARAWDSSPIVGKPGFHVPSAQSSKALLMWGSSEFQSSPHVRELRVPKLSSCEGAQSSKALLVWGNWGFQSSPHVRELRVPRLPSCWELGVPRLPSC